MIEPEVEKYTKPCPDNGVKHDCTHEYLMWWDRDAFDRWLTAHDKKLAVNTLRDIAALARGEDALGVSSVPVSWILEVAEGVERS